MVLRTVAHNTSFLNVSNSQRILKPSRVTPGLLQCIRQRDQFFRKCRQNSFNEVLNLSYNRYKNLCNNLVKKIKRDYVRDQFEKYKNNGKKT